MTEPNQPCGNVGQVRSLTLSSVGQAHLKATLDCVWDFESLLLTPESWRCSSLNRFLFIQLILAGRHDGS